MAFHPLVDLLQRQFGVEEGDGEAAIAHFWELATKFQEWLQGQDT